MPTPATARPKFSPRPPRSAEERLPLLYRALTDQIDDGHFQNAKKTCRKILALDPASTPTFQALLFLLLDTDDYAASLELVTAPPAGQTGGLEFERAYCLYRLKREGEALEVLSKVAGERRARVLEAQIRYRLGEYERAQEIYEDLLSSVESSSAEYDDIQTNLSATAAHLAFLAHDHTAHLSAPARASVGTSAAGASELKPYTPTEAELESYVPGLPSGWGSRGVTKAAVGEPHKAVKKDKPEGADGGRKTRHRLPKGASADRPFSGDPERWMPLRQRATYIAAQSKKKGAKESMGTGFTQGSTASGGGGGGGGGGNKNKKGKTK
ncbi:hypothetical protein Q5752_002912 [Cryptotrichosporon argae]